MKMKKKNIQLEYIAYWIKEIKKREEEKKSRIPEHFKVSITLLVILIKSHLCVINLIKNKINNDLLDIIIKKVRFTFSNSLINYGMAMGIVAALCISNPLTQFVIDSKHRSGVGGEARTSTIDRVKEIVGAKQTEKMKKPIMSLRVNEELENNKNIRQKRLVASDTV